MVPTHNVQVPSAPGFWCGGVCHFIATIFSLARIKGILGHTFHCWIITHTVHWDPPLLSNSAHNHRFTKLRLTYIARYYIYRSQVGVWITWAMKKKSYVKKPWKRLRRSCSLRKCPWRIRQWWICSGQWGKSLHPHFIVKWKRSHIIPAFLFGHMWIWRHVVSRSDQ